MLSLLLSCIFVTSLSQVVTYVDTKTGDLHIDNIDYDGKVTDLTIKKMAKEEFVWQISETKSKTLGKYKLFTETKDVGGGNLEFTSFPQMSLSMLESLISKRMIKYNGKLILPHIAYIISAHGGEYKKLIKRPRKRRASMKFLKPTPRPTMPPTPDSENRSPWPYKSTIYFFSGRYTTIPIEDGEEYTEWFESGQFNRLREESEDIGEVIRNGDLIAEHYASYGREFYVSSGVYRVLWNRKTKKWDLELIARLDESTATNLVKLSDIVKTLEETPGFGAGTIYWNACREDTTKGVKGYDLELDYGKTPFGPLFNNQMNHRQTELWRKSVIKDCDSQWNNEWKEVQEFADVKAKDFKRDYEDKELKAEENKSKQKEIVKQCHESVKKLLTPPTKPKFTVYNCFRSVYEIMKIKPNIENEYKVWEIKIDDLEFESSDSFEMNEEMRKVMFNNAHKEYSNYYDRNRHRNKKRNKMSYYDKLVEREEMMDILHDLQRDNQREKRHLNH